ncbi:MAG: FtsX-like permease family protein [Acidobacteriota bacterium]
MRQLTLEHPAQAEIYLAWGTTPLSQSVLIRTSSQSAVNSFGLPRSAAIGSGLAESVRRRIEEALPGTPVFDARTGEQIVRSSYRTRTVTVWTLTAFASLALALGLAGLYGLVLHQVHHRRRELGVRVAVGARPRDLLGWALGQGLRPAALGATLGVLGAVLAGRAFESQLFGVSAHDPGVLAGAAAVTLATAILAALIPARGAARVDPATALRAE